MTISRTLALVIIVGTGIAGAFIGRAARNDAPRTQGNTSMSPAPSGTTPADDGCEAERAAHASIKAQLATCMTLGTAAPETTASGAPEPTAPGVPEPTASGTPEPSSPELQAVIADEIKSYQERLRSLSEAVIVRHSSGIIRVYKPDEWPIDGDGVVIGRKFSDGHIERYPLGERASAPR